MIPKIIHYCWFGHGKKTEKMKKCISSWKHFCPDYQIIEWNEENFDVTMTSYTKYMYENRKYAFLSDFARLFIIYNQGGVYLDTDVELVKPIDELLRLEAFAGFENNEYINTGLGFGAEQKHPAIQAMMKEYDYFPLYFDAVAGPKGCPVLNTEALVQLGLKKDGQLQVIGGITVYPAQYFNPYDSITGELNKTDDTYSIHWYTGSWLPKKKQLRSKIAKPIHRLMRVLHFKN